VCSTPIGIDSVTLSPIDILHREGSLYDVAKMLGDTVETVERHYAPFVTELRERVRDLLQTGTGIEESANIASKRLQTPRLKVI
jgi:hypothetical protein